MIKSTKPVIEENTEKELAYSYYSKALNKPFDTLDELQKAEQKHFDEKKAKEVAVKEKKADADAVQDAFKLFNKEKSVYKEEISKARKACMKKISDAKLEYSDAIEAAEKSVREAERDYNKALKEFTDKHPEGYHVTLRDGDNVTTIMANAPIDDMTKEMRDFYSSMWDAFWKLF